MKRYNVLIWSLFLLERLTFYALFPLDWRFAYQRMQNLDVWSLKTDFWTSLFCLHSQPPLFNAFVGVVAKIAPDACAGLVVQAVFLALAILAFRLYRALTAALIASPRVRNLGDFAYLACPTILFAERWFAYTFPVTVLLLALAFCLLRHARSGRTAAFAGFAATAAVLVLTRSFFHVVVWMIPTLACAFFAHGGKVKTRLALAMCALAVASVPYVANMTRHGLFTSSTWQGMNLFNTLHYLPDDVIRSGVADGILHPVCELRGFAPLADYQARLSEGYLPPPATTSPSLGRTRESLV